MAMRPLLVFIFVFLTPSLRGKGVQLFETEEAGTRIFHKCKGSNLTLYEADDEVTVLHVFVFLGRESLASSSVPATGMFEKRLTVHNNGRVTLTNLTSDDLGRYRVEVQAEDKITHNIRLIIKEPPRSADGKLLVMKNALSDTNSIRLMCGTFTTLGFPPVSAVWKDPAGRTLSSDGFNDEYFYLDVPADTADSGDYCCQLDCRAPDFCCLDDQSPLRSCATIPVHTDRMVEVTTDDKMSLGNLTQAMAYLVQRQARCDQLDTYITKVETLQVDMLKGIENMRNTTTDARVQLETETNHKLWNFQLQMDSNASKVMESCNVSQQQLLTTVSDKLLQLEMKLNKDLVDLNNASFTADRRLEANINKSVEHLQKVHLQLDTNISKAVESFNELNERLMETSKELQLNQTNFSYQVENIVTRLDKDGGIELKLTKASDQVKDLQKRTEEISEATDKHQSQLEKQITELAAEGKTGLSGLQQITSDLRTTLTSNVQTLTNLTSKTKLRVLKLEKKLSTIHNTLNRLETNTNKSLEAIRSYMSAIYKATPKGECLLKTGYVWYQRTCLKLSTRQVDYVTAKVNCEADGAHLYDIKSPVLDEERVRFAIKQSGLSRDIDIWLGGNDLEIEGDYRWSDGTPLSSSFKLWETGQPSDSDETINIIVTYKHPHQQKAVTNTDVTIVHQTLYVAKSSSYGRGRCL
ncbi:C-type lectin domain family 4 member F-like [Pomacea canaliculata]|uniref:C-type lectin domain family 4 member F-like n=1 Tax=Pomacea canaliculata TaxID=400727 RepID=UPI000D72BE55|nr:C-type lectin domain family 4 member F-like [Pomacea canaliculata]XP_025091643.1 C-type lectin domain family 4 member F-like [Pomacea canaliculata]